MYQAFERSQFHLQSAHLKIANVVRNLPRKVVVAQITAPLYHPRVMLLSADQRHALTSQCHQSHILDSYSRE